MDEGLVGNATVLGSMVVKHATFVNNARFYYDEALSETLLSWMPPLVEILSWRED